VFAFALVHSVSEGKERFNGKAHPTILSSRHPKSRAPGSAFSLASDTGIMSLAYAILRRVEFTLRAFAAQVATRCDTYGTAAS
jgi:hypothetical protein